MSAFSPDGMICGPTRPVYVLYDTHGTVEATREVPQIGFPFVVYAIWRPAAQRRPFRRLECGAAVHAD